MRLARSAGKQEGQDATGLDADAANGCPQDPNAPVGMRSSRVSPLPPFPSLCRYRPDPKLLRPPRPPTCLLSLPAATRTCRAASRLA
jgi:hypothetical protein